LRPSSCWRTQPASDDGRDIDEADLQRLGLLCVGGEKNGAGRHAAAARFLYMVFLYMAPGMENRKGCRGAA
jgi:hypothetical protein